MQNDKMISVYRNMRIKSVCIKTAIVAALINYNANVV